MHVAGLFLAVAFVVLVPAVISALALRYHRGWIAALMVLGSFAGLLFYNAASANNPSFEAIGPQVMSLFVFAPAFVGALIGVAFGWWKWRRAP